MTAFLAIFVLLLVHQAAAQCDSTKCKFPNGQCQPWYFSKTYCSCNYRYSGTNCQDTTLPLVPAAQGVLPPELYQKLPTCPFARWNPVMPERTKVWEKSMVDKYHSAWVAKGSPRGVELNDHNYNTLLGQGNTLGFYGANLFINPNALPKEHQIGLFSKQQDLPALVRFSDFGADGSVQLGRMAVKIPYAGSWTKEMNLLFTETLDTFPLNDFDGVAKFVSDASVLGMSSSVGSGISGAWSLLNSAASLFKEINEGDMAGKTYYSQVPYAFGDKMAFRYRLVPKTARLSADSVKRGVAACLQSLISKLSKGDLTFVLEIQVHSNASHPDVVRGAAYRWDLPYRAVGALVLKKQEADSAGVSTFLRLGLGYFLNSSQVELAAIHKMFTFHPISNPDAHRPVGETNSYRSDFYAHHAADRMATISSGFSQNYSRYNVPFQDLVNAYNAYIAPTPRAPTTTTAPPTPAKAALSIFTLEDSTKAQLVSDLDSWKPEDPQTNPPTPPTAGSSLPPSPAAPDVDGALSRASADAPPLLSNVFTCLLGLFLPWATSKY